MMSQSSPQALIGAQTLALQNFSSIFAELSKIFDLTGLVGIAAAFIQSVHTHNSTITVEKLKMIKGLIHSQLFLNPESRGVLAPVVTSQVDLSLIFVPLPLGKRQPKDSYQTNK